MQHLLILMVVIVTGIPALALPQTVRAILLDVAAGQRASVLAVVGLTMGAWVYMVVANRSARFWRVLHHEMSHAFVALLMLAWPSSLVVDGGGGGHIKYGIAGPLAGLRTFLIGIAPYCVSPVGVIAGASLVMAPTHSPWFGAAAAAAIGLGLAATMMEISPRQPDLTQRGFVFASACSLWIWCAGAAVLLQCLVSTQPIATVANTYQLGLSDLKESARLVAREMGVASALLFR